MGVLYMFSSKMISNASFVSHLLCTMKNSQVHCQVMQHDLKLSHCCQVCDFKNKISISPRARTPRTNSQRHVLVALVAYIIFYFALQYLVVTSLVTFTFLVHLMVLQFTLFCLIRSCFALL